MLKGLFLLTHGKQACLSTQRLCHWIQTGPPQIFAANLMGRVKPFCGNLFGSSVAVFLAAGVQPARPVRSSGFSARLSDRPSGLSSRPKTFYRAWWKGVSILFRPLYSSGLYGGLERRSQNVFMPLPWREVRRRRTKCGGPPAPPAGCFFPQAWQ